MRLFAGIDIAMEKFAICIITEDGEIVRRGECDMSIAGFREFRKYVTEDTLCVMESTARYHIKLDRFLTSEGIPSRVVNPLLISKFGRSLSLRKTKTDKADALLIAKYALQNYATLSKEISPAMEENIQALSRRRLSLAEDLATAKTQLKQDLDSAWPEILALDVLAISMLRFLSVFGCPGEVLAARNKDLEKIFNQKRRGRNTDVTVKRIKELAEDSIGIDYYAGNVKDSAARVLFFEERLKSYTKELIKAEKKIHPQEMQILTSIPGVGEITAAHFMVEIGDIRNFETYQNLIAFAGTDPSLKQSGKHNGRGRISKHGNSVLRKTCYQMADGAIKHNRVLKAYYDKKKEEGFPHRKAMIAVANKLLKVIFVLLKRGELYRIEVQ